MKKQVFCGRNILGTEEGREGSPSPGSSRKGPLRSTCTRPRTVSNGRPVSLPCPKFPRHFA